MKCYVFLSTGIYTEVVILIRHVKGQLLAPYMETQCLEVCYGLHVGSTCKSSCSVLLMQDFSLLSLLSSDNSTAVQRKPGESQEGLVVVSVKLYQKFFISYEVM